MTITEHDVKKEEEFVFEDRFDGNNDKMQSIHR